MQWADNRCKSKSLPVFPESRRQVLGAETIELIRFPLMTLGQIQWEVVPSGLLEFKDMEALQNIISKRSMMMGRFSAESRHYPVSGFLQREQNWAGRGLDEDAIKIEKDKLVKRYLGSYKTLANEMFDVDETGGKLAPAVPTYAHCHDDEVDAVLGSRLLRGHCDKFVEDLSNNFFTLDAVGGVQSDETRVTLALDPDLPIDVLYEQARESKQPIESRKKASKAHTTMLMHTESFVAQDFDDEDEQPGIEASNAGSSFKDMGVQPAVNYTDWGSVPEPQDFERLTNGFYCFRGDRFLEMKLQDGEPMVHEHEADEDSMFVPDLEDLKLCKDAEAIRRELDLEDELPAEKVPLDVFLCRQ